MKNISLIIMLILFFVLSIYHNEAQKEGIEINVTQMLENLSVIEADTQNIAQNITPYANLYTEEITLKKTIHNIINPIIYTITTEINTIIPIIVKYVLTGEYIKILIPILLIIFILSIPKIIKWIILIWFFIQEKKKSKLKIYE